MGQQWNPLLQNVQNVFSTTCKWLLSCKKCVAHLLEDKLLVDGHQLAALPAGLQRQVGADNVARHAAHGNAGVVAELALGRHLKELRAPSVKELITLQMNALKFFFFYAFNREWS